MGQCENGPLEDNGVGSRGKGEGVGAPAAVRDLMLDGDIERSPVHARLPAADHLRDHATLRSGRDAHGPASPSRQRVVGTKLVEEFIGLIFGLFTRVVAHLPVLVARDRARDDHLVGRLLR